MQTEEITATLAATGYRPITVRSYQEFISGIRYVSIETLGTEGFKVLQFMPNDNKNWDIVRWQASDSSSVYICRAGRNTLNDTAQLSIGYEWYAKVAEKIATTQDYFVGDPITGYHNRGAFFQTLEMFLENNKGGSRNPFDVAYAFERAHPANPTARALADIDRQRAELEAREAAMRHRDNFAQVDELRTLGAQALALNDRERSAYYYREADLLRARIQVTLDRGEQVVRETITPPSQERPWGGWDIGNGTWTLNGVPINQSNSTPKLTTVETVKREPRVIQFDDED